jgi:predicted nucleotidyltransferase
LREVRRIIAEVIPDTEVWIFGSRATGQARLFSDLYLLFTKAVALDCSQRFALRDGFEACDLPFMVDIAGSAGPAGEVAERIAFELIPLSP